MGRCSLGKEAGQVYPLAHLQGLGERTDSLGQKSFSYSTWVKNKELSCNPFACVCLFCKVSGEPPQTPLFLPRLLSWRQALLGAARKVRTDRG